MKINGSQPGQVVQALEETIGVVRFYEAMQSRCGETAEARLFTQLKVLLLLVQGGKPADVGHLIGLEEIARAIPGVVE